MNSSFQRKNILQNVYDLDFQQTRLSLLNLFNNEEYIENGITYSRPHFKFLYDSKTKRNLVFINLDLINYLIDEKLIPISNGFQDEIDNLDERVTINYNLIQTIFSSFLERIFFEDDNKVYIYTQKYNLTTLQYEFELYDLAGKLNKSEFDNFYTNEFQILESDVSSISTNLNNLQDDFDALTTNLSTNYYTKLQTYSQTEINNFLNNKIDKISTTNNNIWYLYFQRNNTIQISNVQSQSTIIYYKLFQSDQVVYVLRQVNNIHSLWNIFNDIFTKTEVNNLLLDYYQKINLVSAVKYVLSQTNNVLSLYNLKDDFYDETEIDLMVGNLESEITTLNSIKLTTPVNTTGTQKVIAVNADQTIELISNGGGGSLIYYTEDHPSKTAKIDISSNNKLSITETNSIIKNNFVDIQDNNSLSIFSTSPPNSVRFFDNDYIYSERFLYLNFGQYSQNLQSTQPITLFFNLIMKKLSDNTVMNNNFMKIYNPTQKPADLNTCYTNNQIDFNGNVNINALNTLKVNKILPISGNIINLGETNNTTTYVRINSFFRKNFIENYINNVNQLYYYYFSQTSSSKLSAIPNNVACFSLVNQNTNYSSVLYNNTFSNGWEANISLSVRQGITCAFQMVGESSIFLKKIVEKDQKQIFNYQNIIYEYKDNYKDQGITSQNKIQYFGIFVENLHENQPQLICPTTYNLCILENKKQKYLGKIFKEKIEITLFCELFDIDKEDLFKYQLRFEFLVKEIKILEINLLYIFFEGDLEFNENDQIIIHSFNLNADKCLQHLLFQTKTLKEENNQLKEQINNMQKEFEKRLEKIEKLLLQN